MIVNKITLIRMKKLAYQLKQKGATDETTSIFIKTSGKGEADALNSLIENNYFRKTEDGKFYLKQKEKAEKQEENER